MAEVSLTRWLPHLEAVEQSGLSIAAYARQHNLSAHTLYAARKALRERKPDAPAVSPHVERFTSVKLAPSSTPVSDSPVEIRVATRLVLRLGHLPDPAWLVTLTRLLEQRP